MKILLISASPRKEKSQTFILAKEVLKGASLRGAKTETIHLCNLKIGFCRHCESCHMNIMRCPVKDDAMPLLGKMLESDGIIFASPVYIHQITGYLKMLLDRSSHLIHCQRLEGKYVSAVATAGGGPQDGAVEYLKNYALICGAQFLGAVSTIVPLKENVKAKARALGRQIVAAIKSKNELAGQKGLILGYRQYFRKIIEPRKGIWKGEYEYWKGKGWL